MHEDLHIRGTHAERVAAVVPKDEGERKPTHLFGLLVAHVSAS
jgi:hypothetical protein